MKYVILNYVAYEGYDVEEYESLEEVKSRLKDYYDEWKKFHSRSKDFSKWKRDLTVYAVEKELDPSEILGLESFQ